MWQKGTGASFSQQRYFLAFHFPHELDKLYRLSGNQLIWSKNGHLTPQAHEAIQSLQQAESLGLDPDKYAVSHLSESWQILRSSFAGKPDLTSFDRALSAALMQFISDLHRGQADPLETGFKVVAARKPMELAEMVLQFSHSKHIWQAIQRLEPRFGVYQRLKDTLRTYQELVEQYQWKPLLVTKTVHSGDPYPDLKDLRSFLIAVGDLEKEAPITDRYEGRMVDAVKHFQHRHGLETDGVIGTRTFKALNTPLTKRVEQIKLALERLRWLEEPKDGPHIVVNIPAFELYAFQVKDGMERLVLKMDVIVGSALDKHETPVFTARMKYLVFRPYWNVPYSITIKELIPKVRRDPYYLHDHNYEVLEGHTVITRGYVDEEILADLRSGRYRIRQRPGRHNALGLIKFIFPNSNSIYLHDTPAQRLFRKTRRDFSHGCIRVEEPLTLAEFVLDQQAQPVDRQMIEWAMLYGPDDQKILLDREIPVAIFYTTAMVRENGDVAFFEDIYDHDRHLRELLRKVSQKILINSVLPTS